MPSVTKDHGASDERERFEAWARPRLFLLRRDLRDPEQYEHMDAECAWQAWQAASADRLELLQALQGLMELERRGRFMPIGSEWDAARAAIAKYERN